jgi:peroxiredoxin
MTLLADPELEVIRKFGLVHHKGLTTTSPVFRVFGLPIGIPKRFEQMALPTSLLIDEQGIVRWIDQAEDYRVRSDVARVEAALREVWADAAAVDLSRT